MMALDELACKLSDACQHRRCYAAECADTAVPGMKRLTSTSCACNITTYIAVSDMLQATGG
jgi:hypothetical protein